MQAKPKSSGRARIGLRREARFRRRRLTVVAASALALLAAAGGGMAVAVDPTLETRLESAQSDAGQLQQRLEEQAAQIADLQGRAREAGAREMELAAEIERTAARSRELAAKLTAADHELQAVRARYKQAVEVLSGRLVEIYKGSAPDSVTLLLEADGYDDLETRAEYLQALHDADQRLAERVEGLHEQLSARFEEVSELKAGVDQQARQLEASRSELAATRAEAEKRSVEVADAKAATEGDLAEVERRVAELEAEQQQQEQEQEQEQEEAASGGEAFSGGPFAIPTYIVICESGGNYSALNSSSGAGGAYQILPSTWRAYGGRGLPHQASKAEQDRIAAMIWRDSGPSAWSCA